MIVSPEYVSYAALSERGIRCEYYSTVRTRVIGTERRSDKVKALAC